MTKPSAFYIVDIASFVRLFGNFTSLEEYIYMDIGYMEIRSLFTRGDRGKKTKKFSTTRLVTD